MGSGGYLYPCSPSRTHVLKSRETPNSYSNLVKAGKTCSIKVGLGCYPWVRFLVSCLITRIHSPKNQMVNTKKKRMSNDNWEVKYHATSEFNITFGVLEHTIKI